MHVFLTGANGWIGSAVSRELLDADHSVVGLVRSREKGEALSREGITPLIGGEEGIPFRLIAEAIGRQLGVPAKSLTPEDAEAHFGGLATWVAGNGPASSRWTRDVVGWEPEEIGLVADIERPGYSA